MEKKGAKHKKPLTAKQLSEKYDTGKKVDFDKLLSKVAEPGGGYGKLKKRGQARK